MDVTEDRTEQLVRQTLTAVASQVRSSEDASDEVQVDERSVTSRSTVTALRRSGRRNRRSAGVVVAERAPAAPPSATLPVEVL